MAKRRADAEGRDESGRFVPKAKAEGDVDDGTQAKADPAKPEKPAEKPKDAGADAALKAAHDKLAADHKATTTRLATAEKHNADWEDVGRKMEARLERDGAYIAHLEGQLKALKASIDPRVPQMLSMQEQIAIRKAQDDDTAAARKADDDARAQAAQAQERAQLQTEMHGVLAKFPELKPPFTDANREAGEFWQALKEFLATGPTNAQVRPMLAQASAVAAAIKARVATPAPQPPRMLGRSTGGGTPKPKDRQDYRDKWNARVGAV